MFKEFKQFLLRGNVVDLAIGIVVGAAFTSVVNALVTGIINPLVAAIFKAPTFNDLAFTVHGSTFMIGGVLNAIISFILVAATVFFLVVKPINILVAKSRKQDAPPADPSTKKCTECLSEIPKDARRCAHCCQPQ